MIVNSSSGGNKSQSNDYNNGEKNEDNDEKKDKVNGEEKNENISLPLVVRTLPQTIDFALLFLIFQFRF